MINVRLHLQRGTCLDRTITVKPSFSLPLNCGVPELRRAILCVVYGLRRVILSGARRLRRAILSVVHRLRRKPPSAELSAQSRHESCGFSDMSCGVSDMIKQNACIAFIASIAVDVKC